MNGVGRVDAVFAGLVVATCVTWWLGSESSSAGAGFELAATLTILIAVTKIFLIGTEFMELRKAPMILKTAFFAWLGVFTAGTIAMVVI